MPFPRLIFYKEILPSEKGVDSYRDNMTTEIPAVHPPGGSGIPPSQHANHLRSEEFHTQSQTVQLQRSDYASGPGRLPQHAVPQKPASRPNPQFFVDQKRVSMFNPHSIFVQQSNCFESGVGSHYIGNRRKRASRCFKIAHLFWQGELHELKLLLRQLPTERDINRQREVLKKVIAYMTVGMDVSRLFSEMVMLSSTTDMVQKKMVYLYLTNYAGKKRMFRLH